MRAVSTLEAVTTAHSRRLSALHQRRDAELRDALVIRDSELRALPETASLYAKYDKAVAEALDERLETEHKAAAARESAFAKSSDARGQSLIDAQTSRRTEDLEAMNRRLQAEAAAEKRFREALSGLSSTTALELRQKTTREAERARQREIEDARESYAAAIASAQATYRRSTDTALLDERTSERAAEHAFAAARRVAAASEAAATSAARRALLEGLEQVAAARDAIRRYHVEVERVRTEALRDEQTLFAQFRDDLKRAS
jgi:hypothetical protein